MAYDGFLKIGDLVGESSDLAHRGWIEILSFEHETKQPTGPMVSIIGGRTGARVAMGDFKVTKIIDRSTPDIQVYCCDGSHIEEVKVVLRESGGTPVEFMKWTFGHAIISCVRQVGRGNEETYARPIEEISFNFSSVRWQYTPQSGGGSAEAMVEGGWDLEQNRKL